jgi:hypothetical protein
MDQAFYESPTHAMNHQEWTLELAENWHAVLYTPYAATSCNCSRREVAGGPLHPRAGAWSPRQ